METDIAYTRSGVKYDRIKRREYARRRRLLNPEKVHAYDRARYIRDSEKIKARVSEWSRKNKEKVKETKKIWHEKNKEKIAQKRLLYGIDHAEEIRKRDQRRRHKSSPAHLNNVLKQLFGITLERFQEMNTAQGGLCAICRNPPQRSRLSVDHCHKTGKIRGLLCGKCNSGIGLLGDSLETVNAASNYLKRHA